MKILHLLYALCCTLVVLLFIFQGNFRKKRELEKSEITAELEMLADESYKTKIKEDHEASHHLNANKF